MMEHERMAGGKEEEESGDIHQLPRIKCFLESLKNKRFAECSTLPFCLQKLPRRVCRIRHCPFPPFLEASRFLADCLFPLSPPSSYTILPMGTMQKSALEKEIAATLAHKSQAPRRRGKKCSKPFSRKKLFFDPREKNQHLSLFNMGRRGLLNTFFSWSSCRRDIGPSILLSLLSAWRKKEEENWDSAKGGPKKKPFLLLHPEIPPSFVGGGGGGGG